MTYQNNMLPSQEFVYMRTYARWIEEESRRETWPETVERVVSFLEKERPTTPAKVFRKIRSSMLSLDVLPSMRLVWAAGEAARKNPVTIYNCSFIAMRAPEDFAEMLFILMCGTGVGFSVELKNTTCLPEVPVFKATAGKELYQVEDDKEGWANSLLFLLKALYAGNFVEFDYSKVRPKGARLKTMGGRASGPEPLANLHSFVTELFYKAQGRRLSPLEVHDICNKIAEIVVVGGVRRSSQISLSDLESLEMRDAKNWPCPLHRFMANNSAVYYVKPDGVTFLKEWHSLAASGSGERGIFNLGAVQANAPARRNPVKIEGTNPCVTGDTTVLTKEGHVAIETLVDRPVEVWNGFEWSLVTPRVTGHNQPLLRVKFSDGRELVCTPYHKFHLAINYQGQTKVVEAAELRLDDKLIKHILPVIDSGENAQFNAYAQGFKAADGMDGYNFLALYAPKYMCLKRLDPHQISPEKGGYKNVWVDAPKEKNYVPFELSIKDRLNWLAGYLDGDGCELREGGAQITSIDKSFLQKVQQLLATLGVDSKLNLSHEEGLKFLPNGKGGHSEYFCQKAWRLCVGAVQIQHLKALGLTCERLLFNKSPQRDASHYVRVVGIEEAGMADKVFCFTEPKRNLGLFNGVLTGNCGEIALRNHQFCNLSTVIVRPEDTIDTLLKKVETATWLGTIQASFTDFPYLRKSWKDNCEDEALLGVSLSGQMDNRALLANREFLAALKKKAIDTNKKAAKTLGISVASSITCGKPEGTTSQLTHSGSGCHPWYGKYYIRRYRISANDPLVALLKESGVPLKPEVGQELDTANTLVAEFPLKAPSGAVTRHEVSAMDQLEWYKHIQTTWCEHNQSITVYVKPDEWLEVGAWVYENWSIACGLSFLPYDGGHYALAPYEEITKEEYEKRQKDFPSIDYSRLSFFELEDATEGAKTYACVGDKCEII
jgi:ribonucleotide reductase, class II